jgi:hypothetical protein
MAYWMPYYHTDQPYGDTEGDDGIPDVIVARIPVTTSAEIAAFGQKIEDYNTLTLGVGLTPSAQMLVCNHDVPECDVEVMMHGYTHIREGIPGTSRVDVEFDDLPAADTGWGADSWNRSLSDIVVLYGTESMPAAPGMFFDIRPGAFSLGLLCSYPVHMPPVIAPLCGTAIDTRINNVLYSVREVAHETARKPPVSGQASPTCHRAAAAGSVAS